MITVAEDRQAIEPGTRVRVIRDPEWEGPWPSEPTGIVEPILGEPFRMVQYLEEPMREYMVAFEEPARDADGDGPYSAAVIWAKYLEVIEPGPVSADQGSRTEREARDAALRHVLDHPEEGEIMRGGEG